jgi:glycosyltransferase involved in cell wall biosynthesis
MQTSRPQRENAVAAPRVSIIMNVRNGLPFLRESIESVLAQTVDDWELIFWDDRSTDGSADVLRDYTDTRIRYVLADEPVGLGRARNLAIHAARGEWIAFLDQDDLWLPDKLARQLAALNAAGEPSRVGILYGRAVMFSPSGAQRDFDHRHEFEPLPQGDIFRELFAASCFICISSAMLRRSAVMQLGGIPQEIAVIPDYFLFTGVAQSFRAVAVEEVVCRYRLHAANMSRATRRRMHEEALWLLERWEGTLESRLLAHRRRIHQTLVGLEDAKRAGAMLTGIHRIVARGSFAFLLSRPFVRVSRALRRRVQTPRWKRMPMTKFVPQIV